MHGNAPPWLAARDAARLPDNWRSMPNVEAVAIVAGKVPNACEGTPFQNNGATGDSCAPVLSTLPVNPAYERYSNGGAG